MALRTDEVQLRVLIDGSPARKELAELSRESYKLRDEQKKLQDQEKSIRAERAKYAQGSPEYRALTQDLKANKAALGEVATALEKNGDRQSVLRKEIGLTALSLKELQTIQKQLSAQLRVAVPGTEAYQKLEAELLKVEQRLKEVGGAAGRVDRVWANSRTEMKLTDRTMEDLEKEVRRLTIALRTMDPNSALFSNTRKELAAVKERLTTVQSGLGPFGRAWQTMKGSVAGTVAGLTAVLGGGALINGIKGLITGSGKLSDELANMQKATGKTKQEVVDLNKELTHLDTRTANTDLREIVVGLGQAGQEASAQAVAAIDKINVALGDEFGAGAKEITGTLSVLRNGFQDIKTGNYGEDVMRIGNALNVLGANGLATAPVVSDIASRVAGAATQYKIASGDVLGLAATFQELGINTERGSTAYIKVLQKIAGEPKKFAKLVKDAGGDVDLFSKQVNTDLQAAFVTVAKSAKVAGTNNTAFAEVLKDLGTEGVGVGELLSKIGANSEMLATKTKLAGDALKNTASITEEFNTKNTTLGAQLDKIGKAMAGAFVNSSITSGIKGIVDQIVRWTETPLSETLEQERIGVQKTYAMILTYNVGNETRTKLIQELQAQYPGFLKNIDAETVGNQQLGLAVKELNQQLVNKIILQKKDEEIQQQLNQQADRQQKVFDQEDAVREKLVRLAEKENLQYKEGVPILEQAEDLYNRVAEARRRNNQLSGGVAFDDLAKFGKAIKELSASYSFLNSEQTVSNKLTEERSALLARFNIAETPVSPTGTVAPTATTTTTTTTTTALTPEEIAAAEAKRKEIQKNQDEILRILEKAREDILQAGMTADERELRQLDVKQKAERDQLLANAQHTAADLKALDDLQANERANLIETQGDRRAKAAADAAAKVTKAEQDAQDQVYLDQLSAADREINAEMEKMDAMVAIYDKAGVDTQNVVQRTEKAILAIRKKYAKQQREETIKAKQDRIQEQIQTYQAVGTAIAGVNNLLSAAYAASGQANYEQTVAGQALGLAQIAIASGVGVAEAIKAGAGLTFPANLAAIATGVGAVLSGIANAISLVNSAKPKPPESSGAGPTDSGNVQGIQIGEKGVRELDGPDHAGGGLNVVDPETGRVKYNIEGGETLVAKDVSSANPQLMDELIAAAYRQDKRVAATGRGALSGSVVGMALGGLLGGPIGMALGGVLGMAMGGAVGHNNYVHGTALVNATAPINGSTGGGIAGGSLHSDGGNDVVDTQTGQVIANVEKNEALLVMSRKATEANADLIPMMLAASRKGERFNFLNAPLPKPSPSAMRIVHMAQGGMLGMEIPVKKQKNPGATDSGGEAGSISIDLSGLEKRMDRLIDRTEQVGDKLDQNIAAVERNRNVNFRFNQDYKRASVRWDLLQARNTAKRRRA